MTQFPTNFSLLVYDKTGKVIDNPDLTKGHVLKYYEMDEETHELVLVKLEYEEGAPEYPDEDENDPAVLKMRLDEMTSLLSSQTEMIEELTLFAADIVGGEEE